VRWGSDGDGSGALAAPAGVALGSDSGSYVVDPFNQGVTRFDSGGSYLDQWGEAGTDNGQFLYPRAIVAHGEGKVFVADTENDRVQRFAPDGR
jgi:DNA-binding beta-propeller fold protein YncE